MKNKFYSIYALFAVFCLFAAIVLFSFTIFRTTAEGRKDAELGFAWLIRQINELTLSEGFLSDNFVAKLAESCSKSRLLTSCLITGSSETLFAWPADAMVHGVIDPSSEVLPQTSLIKKAFSITFDAGAGRSDSYVLTGVYYTIHPDDIFYASRNACMLVLSVLFVSIIVLIAFSGSGNAKVATQSKDEDASFDETCMRVEESIKQNQIPVECIAPGPARNMPVENPVDPLQKNTDEIHDFSDSSIAANSHSEEKDLGDIEQVHIPNEPIKILESVKSQPSAASNPVPEGLFSPITGIGWEQYLEARLDAELERAASSEQDLALMILKVSSLVHTDLLARKISKVLTDMLRFKDMVFEFDKEGFAGILQNTNLDQAMRIADDLYAAIDSLLLEMESDSRIAIGITTRTARLLPASRMIDEALSASRKAEEEQSLPIVAFRANPEKYRTFISETIR